MRATRRHPWLGPVMLMLALGPVAVAVIACAVHWLTQPAWRLDEPLWGLVVAQVVAIAAFSAHAASNEAVIREDAVGHWVFEFVTMQTVAMVGYWRKHL